MNIFHLSKNPKFCAEWLCDKHCVKMILETGQMLCTAYQRHFGLKDDLYKPAYPKHPMTIWVGDTRGNFEFSLKLLDCLLDEYTKRYGKVHSTHKIKWLLLGKYTKWSKLTGEKSIPPLCMPDEYKENNYVKSYRKYYIGEKKRIAKYKFTKPPYWLGDLFKEQRELVKEVSHAE
jgi:hypothetical protein